MQEDSPLLFTEPRWGVITAWGTNLKLTFFRKSFKKKALSISNKESHRWRWSQSSWWCQLVCTFVTCQDQILNRFAPLWITLSDDWEQQWGNLSRLGSCNRVREYWWDWSLLASPGTGQDGLLALTGPISQERSAEVQPVFHHPLRVPVGSSESQRFPRKQKQICLVINLAYVWCSLAFLSSYFIILQSQKELEIQYFSHNNLELKLCSIQVYFLSRFMAVMKNHLNN